MILDRFKVPEADIVRVPEAALRQTTQAIIEGMGVTADEAAEAADVLVMTDLRAVETHGVSHAARLVATPRRQANLRRLAAERDTGTA